MRHSIVLSSRIRLARNIRNIPFPSVLTEEGLGRVLEIASDSFERIGEEADRLEFVDFCKIGKIEKESLVENHLVSPDLAKSNKKCGAFISGNKEICIMVNEEDHFRIQCIIPGMNLVKAYDICDVYDAALDRNIDMAFSLKYGYLTSCPSNVGTGLRASVMLHLPALTMTGHIKNILEFCVKVGIAVRGVYGEHSKSFGNIYQFSNQKSLGMNEQDIIAGIIHATHQILTHELELRESLEAQNKYGFMDKICRSYGILTNAKILSAEESMTLLSDVRLGVDMGYIDLDIEKINNVAAFIQPASLQNMRGQELNSHERDIIRAEIIKKYI